MKGYVVLLAVENPIWPWKILFSLGTRSDEDPEGGEGAEGAGSGLVEVPATASEAVERVLFQPGGGSPGGHSPD